MGCDGVRAQGSHFECPDGRRLGLIRADAAEYWYVRLPCTYVRFLLGFTHDGEFHASISHYYVFITLSLNTILARKQMRFED